MGQQPNVQSVNYWNLLARSFYPNLVKDRTVPASGDAEPDALKLHAVRQQIQAFHQRLNKLTDDAIIQVHQEKTALLSLRGGKEERKLEMIRLDSIWLQVGIDSRFACSWKLAYLTSANIRSRIQHNELLNNLLKP